MKKSKILIPALSFASVGAIVTPMVTSCKNNTPTFSIDLTKAEEWEPSKIKLSGTHTDAKMTEEYYELIKSNPLYLAEDMYLGASILTTNKGENGFLNIWINNIDSTNNLVSIKMEESMHYEDEDEVYNVHAIMEYNNFPYTVKWMTPPTSESNAGERFALVCGFDQTTILTAENWSAHTYVLIQQNGRTTIQEQTVNDKSTDAEKKQVKIPTNITSHHCSECTQG